VDSGNAPARLKLVADARINEEQVVVKVSNDGDERPNMAIGCAGARRRKQRAHPDE